MAISTATARQLCTKAEFTLFSESSSKNIQAFDARGLRARITRARKLQDKFRELAGRQEREARGKGKPQGKRPAEGSAATRKKEQAFVETRERFEKQLAKLEAAPKKASVKTASTKRSTTSKAATGKKTSAKKVAKRKVTTSSPKLPARKANAAKPASRKTTKKAKAKSTSARLKASGNVNRQKHRSADNKRRQSRSDAR